MSTVTTTRLNKYISESGICSRREADRFIEKGHVFINGKRAKIGDQVSPGDKVKVNGQSIDPRDEDELVLIALNKPIGVVCTTESTERNNIVDYVNHGERIFPIGRLDKDSQGLIFLTNNGDLVNKILRAGNSHEKEYLVTVNKPITDTFVRDMMKGVPILGEVTRKCKVTKETPTVFRITLVQGLNRQIRRMCEYFDYDVTKLERVRIMNVPIKGLGVGEWRDLNKKELSELLQLTTDSTSAASPSSKKRKPAKKDRQTMVSRQAESRLSYSKKITSRFVKGKTLQKAYRQVCKVCKVCKVSSLRKTQKASLVHIDICRENMGRESLNPKRMLL